MGRYLVKNVGFCQNKHGVTPAPGWLVLVFILFVCHSGASVLFCGCSCCCEALEFHLCCPFQQPLQAVWSEVNNLRLWLMIVKWRNSNKCCGCESLEHCSSCLSLSLHSNITTSVINTKKEAFITSTNVSEGLSAGARLWGPAASPLESGQKMKWKKMSLTVKRVGPLTSPSVEYLSF